MTIEETDLAALLTPDDFENAARGRLSKMAYDYYRSGADEERTLAENRAAFDRYRIWYRVLVDVAERDLRTSILGTEVSMPVLVAPTAYHRLAHEGGEIASARAAAAAGTIFVLSTLSTTSIEDVAKAAPGPKWFQLYVHKDREFTRSLVARADVAGYRALVLTVDTPLLGRRLADVRNGFGLPEGLTMANLENTMPASAIEGGASALARYVASRHDASLTWRDVEWVCSLSKMPVVLKGIVRADDAARAVDAGARAIIVSNHGARQLDGAPATLDALPEIASAIQGRIPVMLDGGVRVGTDTLKAIGLGANAVLLGRSILWGLAAYGEAGVLRVLDLMREELSRAMALSGCPNLAAIDGSLIRRAAKS